MLPANEATLIENIELRWGRKASVTLSYEEIEFLLEAYRDSRRVLEEERGE